MENKIWKGRITKNTDKEADKFTSSIEIDKNLYIYDLMGTAAHAAGLEKIGILSKKQLEKIFYGLEKIKDNIEKNHININQYEDIHSLIENELGKVVGDISMKVHTGRSRNDQIVLDEKLFIKDAVINILNGITEIQKTILNIAENKINIIIPAYTHMQKAQPVLLAHYLMAYFTKFDRDVLSFSVDFEKCDYLPLGAAACTGSGFSLDRNLLKRLLKFKNLDSNSMDIVGNRDFILDFIYSCTRLMLHLSGFSEDLIIYNSSEYSFIEIDEDFCTGSSIMPQKKNPDILELVRGKYSIVMGNLIQLLNLLKGLTSTYNRDLQEDKKIFFSAYIETITSIEIFKRLLGKIKFNNDKIKKSLKEGFLEATDIADYLVKKGESFRKSHNIVGKIIRFCIDKEIKFKDLKLKELKKYSPYFDNDIYGKVDIESCISNKKVDCGTEINQVNLNIAAGNKRIGSYKNKITELVKRIPRFEEIIEYRSS